jgi:diadenosine tetraphosphate (Ap4A) HIT family hydrolase
MNSIVLWENDDFVISTPKNPHIPYSEGLHIIVAPRADIQNAWADIELSTRAFKLSSQVCKILDELEMAPWFNIQANGNWGLLEGNTPFFHIHIYGRNKTSSWGKPLVLPEAPKTYTNEPMPESDREQVSDALSNLVA